VWDASDVKSVSAVVALRISEVFLVHSKGKSGVPVSEGSPEGISSVIEAALRGCGMPDGLDELKAVAYAQDLTVEDLLGGAIVFALRGAYVLTLREPN
jgi:hypothetical protein